VLPRRAYLRALHDVPAGTELRYSYGRHFDRSWAHKPVAHIARLLANRMLRDAAAPTAGRARGSLLLGARVPRPFASPAAAAAAAAPASASASPAPRAPSCGLDGAAGADGADGAEQPTTPEVEMTTEVELMQEALCALPAAPVLRPSVREWSDPLAYLAAHALLIAQHGLAKVVPPDGWLAPRPLPQAFMTRTQKVRARGGGALPQPL
jgi:hypothetical protein